MIYMPRDFVWLTKNVVQAIDSEFAQERLEAQERYQRSVAEIAEDHQGKLARFFEDVQIDWDKHFKGGASLE